jgi:hypothetical protein
MTDDQKEDWKPKRKEAINLLTVRHRLDLGGHTVFNRYKADGKFLVEKGNSLVDPFYMPWANAAGAGASGGQSNGTSAGEEGNHEEVEGDDDDDDDEEELVDAEEKIISPDNSGDGDEEEVEEDEAGEEEEIAPSSRRRLAQPPTGTKTGSGPDGTESDRDGYGLAEVYRRTVRDIEGDMEEREKRHKKTD